jgi:hypothetical protein
MTIQDYQEAKIALPKLRLAARNPKFLPEFLEALITAKGHAWCMDVRSERRKMAKLVSREMKSLLSEGGSFWK